MSESKRKENDKERDKDKEKDKDNSLETHETSSILVKTNFNTSSLDDFEKNIISDRPIESISLKKPTKNLYKFGHTWAFWYKNGEPVIIIGPHCKYNLLM